MKQIETVAVVGLGAIGASYLAKIADETSIKKTRAVASGARAEKYKKEGVYVNGKRYDFPVFGPKDACAPADLLIVAVKFHQLEEALAEAENQVGPDTIIISLLNGVSSEDVIVRKFGEKNVLLSYVIQMDAVRTGDRTTYTILGKIPFGERKNEPEHFSENVLRLQEFLERIGVRYEIPADMIKSQWEKFMLNVGVNQVSAILRAPYGVLQNIPEARQVVMDAMREVIALSQKEGVNLSETDMKKAFEVMDSLGVDGKTSMLQDVEAERKTEVEMFGGTVIEKAKQHGLPVPVNEVLVKQIRAIEQMYGK